MKICPSALRSDKLIHELQRNSKDQNESVRCSNYEQNAAAEHQPKPSFAIFSFRPNNNKKEPSTKTVKSITEAHAPVELAVHSRTASFKKLII